MTRTDKIVSALSFLGGIYAKTNKEHKNASNDREKENAEKTLEVLEYLKELVENDASTHI